MKIVHSGISFLLILFILAGSAGLRVFKHACEEDGIFTSYFVQLQDHCGEHQVQLPECCVKDQIEKDDCCSDEVDIYQVDFDYFQDSSLELPLFADPISAPAPVWKTQVVNETAACQTVTRPPPLVLSGRSLLIEHQLFRI